MSDLQLQNLSNQTANSLTTEETTLIMGGTSAPPQVVDYFDDIVATGYGNDDIDTTDGNDHITSLGGRDTVRSLSGNNVIRT